MLDFDNRKREREIMVNNWKRVFKKEAEEAKRNTRIVTIDGKKYKVQIIEEIE